jgi:hypothetical protein
MMDSATAGFDYGRDYRTLDLRAHPELYHPGKGEQGVLLVEPYRSELLPLWRFRTPDVARTSAAALWARFEAYLADGDFVGADMARKYLQMGYTRARRYANHKGGRKYGPDGVELPRGNDAVKAESAAIFYAVWKQVEADAVYARRKASHKAQYG